jgi:hypothetical protein
MPSRPPIDGMTTAHGLLVLKIERLLDAWDRPASGKRQIWSGYNPNRNRARVIVEQLRSDGDLKPEAKDPA